MYGVKCFQQVLGMLREANASEGEVVYRIPETQDLLASQEERAQRWLTTSQMGLALALVEIEVTSAGDNLERAQTSC